MSLRRRRERGEGTRGKPGSLDEDLEESSDKLLLGTWRG